MRGTKLLWQALGVVLLSLHFIYNKQWNYMNVGKQLRVIWIDQVI